MVPPSFLSASASSANVPADMLWKLQLRKENAALLERLEEYKRQHVATDSESKRKLKEGEERLDALEVMTAKHELELRKEQEAHDRFTGEIASLKSQMECFLRSQRISEGL